MRKAESVPGFSGTPVVFYVPGGDNKYPSFWIRDFVMICRSGLVRVEVMRNLLRLILSNQNGAARRELANGLRVDPWAIPDHINLPGAVHDAGRTDHPYGPVFFPGSYSPGDDQGGGRYGLRPADDDIYEVVELARLIAAALPPAQQVSFLQERIVGIRVIERLHLGIIAMVVDPETGLCRNTPEDWAAANFHDALQPMGFISLTSCLRFRAAGAMENFCVSAGENGRAREYRVLRERIARSVAARLLMPSGWLMMGSELDRQPDLWSTSMAVCYGLFEPETARSVCEAMLQAYRDGSVAASGYLRHTPVTADAIPGRKVWEDDSGKDQPGYGIYQHGGFWPQPLGYTVRALARVDRQAAVQIARDFIDHTRTLAAAGAPFEWFNPAIPLEQTPALGRWYGPSAALPLEGFRLLETDCEHDTF